MSPPLVVGMRAASSQRHGMVSNNSGDDDEGSEVDDCDEESVDQLLISNMSVATSRPASSVRLGGGIAHHNNRVSSSQHQQLPQKQSSPVDQRVAPAALHLPLPAASFRSTPHHAAAATFANMPVARPIMTPLASAGAAGAAVMAPAGHSPQSTAVPSLPTTARSDHLDLQYDPVLQAFFDPQTFKYYEIRQ